jgi:hypothetical protein
MVNFVLTFKLTDFQLEVGTISDCKSIHTTETLPLNIAIVKGKRLEMYYIPIYPNISYEHTHTHNINTTITANRNQR